MADTRLQREMDEQGDLVRDARSDDKRVLMDAKFESAFAALKAEFSALDELIVARPGEGKS